MMAGKKMELNCSQKTSAGVKIKELLKSGKLIAHNAIVSIGMHSKGTTYFRSST